VFSLSKWYLDCVTEAGDVTIVYTGELRWGAVHLGFSSVLTQGGERHSLRFTPVDTSPICCRSDALGIDGVWTPMAPPIRRAVAECTDWNCIAPATRVRLNNTTGLGYVERLIMTVPPWNLPVKMLRWGRMVADAGFIVWIDQDGRRIVYQNGREAEATELTDTCIAFTDGSRITLDCSLVLREGPLGKTALAGIPAIGRILPRRLLGMTECKWRSRALLTQPGREPISAWAIHERVEWPD
jgi:hypothetical protein